MEQNNIVVMIDDEITRLREVQRILQTLLDVEDEIAPVLQAVSPAEALIEPAPAIEPEADRPVPEPVQAKRYVSRRGISTGRRGPRRVVHVPAPRALDAAVPKAPVVVARSAVVVAKPQPKVEAQPADGTLEAWVRSLRPSSQPA